jgi:hypothetical protein
MVRKVRCDASALASVYSGKGLLIGIWCTRHDSVLQLIPTPAAAPGTVASTWAALHAHGLSRMLPGGVCILGTYDLGRDCALPTESQNVVAGGLLAAEVATLPGVLDVKDPIILVRGQGGRFTVKAVTKSHAAELRPADLKAVDGLLKQLRILRTVVPITAATMAFLPVGSQQESRDALLHAETLSLDAASHALSLSVLQVMPEVYVVDESDKRVFSAVLKHNGSSNDVLNVRLLVPIGCNFSSPTEALHKQHTRELVRLGGALSVCAVVMVDARLGEVLSAVRADVTGTLAARSDLLQELDDDSDDSLQGAPNFAARPLPARVLATPEKLSGLPFCDYVFQDETIDDDVVPRIAEMLSWSKEVQSQYVHAQVEELCKVGSRSSLPNHVIADAVGVPSDSPRYIEGNRPSPPAEGTSSSIMLACGITMAFIVAAVSVAYQLAYPAHSS